MRSGPVNLPASRTTSELFVIDFRKRLELLTNFSFANFREWRIAAEATREWSDRPEKIKATDYLDGLFCRILGPRIITGLHNGMHEQTPVARKERSILALHRL